MAAFRNLFFVWALLVGANLCLAQADAPLPQGVKAVWDVQKAYHVTTPTRERICLNGLWRWQPGKSGADQVPAADWGFFKVPGNWPGKVDYLQKDSQTVFTSAAWKNTKFSDVSSAWYQREITIPADWANRRITVSAEYLNSYASVFVDGQKAGDMRFPAGEVDITALCHPGQKHVLSMLVLALPLKAVMLSYSDTLAAKTVKGSVDRRGLCGDVFLVGAPAGARIDDVRVDTSVRQWQISFNAAIDAAPPDGTYTLQAQITDKGQTVKTFKSDPFKASDIHDGHFAFSSPWKPEKLWDLNTPGNMYDVQLSLLDQNGKVLDAFDPIHFGFRELWIDGRDFRLNGSRIWLSCVPMDNALMSAGMSTYQSARETLQRIKSFGINFVYTHNYGCEPGDNLSYAEILRAADDEGVLVAFSQPHFGQYDWKAPDADQNNGYAKHAEFFVRAAGSHPSVVMYATSHNALGTPEDANPEMIDGTHNERSSWAERSAKLAMRVQAIIHGLDPSRVIYHHSGGNIGDVYTDNFYANFCPTQEMSDWFIHWSTAGVKPVFLCEYGTPLSWDWAMYRGWYKGKREWGSAQVQWQLCLAEWDAQFFGDKAFQITDVEKSVLRWENTQFQKGKMWFRWDYPKDALSSGKLPEQQEIFAKYLTDNIRAFRTLGLSGVCWWDHGNYWNVRDGVSRERKDLKVDWDNLQRPGFSPDFIDGSYESMDTAFERTDWIPTVAAQALYRNNAPLLAYIADDADHVTGKDHNYSGGEKLSKQIIIINNSRQTVTCDCTWSLGLLFAASKHVTIQTGEQERIPLQWELPATAPGIYQIKLNVVFSTGEKQMDLLAINIMPAAKTVKATARIALFDPAGQTGQMLKAMGVQWQQVDAATDLSGFDVLVIGKASMTVDGPGPDLSRVRDGLKVVMFEQTGDVLEKRFGFRVEEYGLRQVFMRVPDHPILAGLQPENLCDWRGAATLLPPQLKYSSTEQYEYAPTINWAGIPVTRLWRCGNYGNVASALIEKPASGDFLPLVDGGFGLQYSPLLEYHEGKGVIIFCQLDVTGRTVADPAANQLASNIINYLSTWKPAAQRSVVYAGDPAGKKFLEQAGITVGTYDGGNLTSDQVLVVGPGGGPALVNGAAAINARSHVLAIGLDESDASTLKVTMKKAEHIASYFEPFAGDSLLVGIGPADVYDHNPQKIPLISAGARVVDDGVLAQSGGTVFCQLVPWQFDYAKQYNLKRTYCRTSYTVLRVLANMGAASPAPILDRFHTPVQNADKEKRWANGLYLDQPQEWDDPYRYFGW